MGHFRSFLSDPLSLRLQREHERQFDALVADAASGKSSSSQPPIAERLKSLESLERLIEKRNAKKVRRLEAFGIPVLVIAIAMLVASLVYCRARTADVEITARVQSFSFRTTKEVPAFRAFPVESVTFAGNLATEGGIGACERLEIRRPPTGEHLLFDAMDLPANTSVEMSIIDEGIVSLRLRPEHPSELVLSTTYPAGSTVVGCNESVAPVAGQFEAEVSRGELAVVLTGFTRSSFQRLNATVPLEQIRFYSEYEWPRGNVRRLSSLEQATVYFEKLNQSALALREGQLLVVGAADRSALEMVRI
jgi:hypothetical protein